MDKSDVVSTLNDLIETSRDGEEGFKQCAENVTDPELKSYFSSRAQRCATAVAELQDMVDEYGGKAETSASVSGALHRRWVDIKAAVTGKDEQAVLDECERGEDVAKASYQKALAKELPADVRALVERQYQGVMQNHDQVKSLRNQARARH
jgi:uncharacterized protein (TIGR02284 family)